MAQSSLGYVDDEEDRANALPLDAEDRASTNLRSPDFQLAAEPAPPPPVAIPQQQDFGTPMSSALGDFEAAPAPQEAAEQAPRLAGADSPEIGDALQALDQGPAPMRGNPRSGGEDWQREADRRVRTNQAQKSGIHAYLASKGVETELLPDGSHAIATHEDGAPRWKPARSQPFTDPETGRPVVRERDERGNLRDIDLFATRGIVHTDQSTGARYYMGPANVPVDLNSPDPEVARANLVKKTRSDLYANEQLASHEVQRIKAAMVEPQQIVAQMGAMAAGGGEFGSKAKPVSRLENLVTSLTPLAEAGKLDETQQQDLKDAQEALQRHYRDFPEHQTAKDAITGGKAQIAAINEARLKDRDRRLALLMDPNTSSAVAAAQPALKGNAGPGEVETAEVDQETAQAAATGRTTQSMALPRVLRGMKASGVQFLKNPAGETRSIDDAIKEAMNPPPKPVEKAARPDGNSYTFDDKDVLQFSKEKPADGLRQALEDGKADAAWAKEHMAEFEDVQNKYEALVKSAGSAPRLKALLHGAGRGGAFLAGAAASQPVVGATVDPWLLAGPQAGVAEFTIPIAHAIGGLAGGTAAAYGYGKLTDKLGEYSAAVKSLNDSAGLHPNYDSAGELISFAASAPKAILNLAKAGSMAKAGALAEGLTEEAGKAAARKVVGGQLVKGAVAGAAFEGVLRPAFDAARYQVADHLGIEHGEVEAPGVKSLVTNVALGLLTAGHGMRFQKFDSTQLASILTRAEIRERAGIPLDKPSTPGAITAAYHAHGIDVTPEDAAKLAAPIPKQQIDLRSALKRQQAALEKAGVFKGFSGAEQVQGPGHLAAVGEPDASGGSSAAPGGATSPSRTEPPPQSGPSQSIPSPEPAPNTHAGQAKAFSDTLRAKDAVGPRLTEEQAGGALSAATNDELNGHDQSLHAGQKEVTEQVSAPIRQRLAAIVGGEATANESHFASDPDAPFVAAHVGKQLRDTYTTPEQKAALDQTVARAGEHAPVAQFVADQHVGMLAAKDLLSIATGKGEVPAERVAELGRLGLVEPGEDGAPHVTHDALPLLPKGLTTRLVNAHERFRVKSLHGEKLEGAAAMARNGQGQLEHALHAKAMAAREAAALKRYPVRVSFTDATGAAREKVIRGRGKTEEEGMAHAMSIAEKRGMKVTHAEVTTPEKEQARRNPILGQPGHKHVYTSFGGKVAGRFDPRGSPRSESQRSMRGAKYNYYGRDGLPYDQPAKEAEYQVQQASTPEAKAQWEKILANHEARIRAELTAEHGPRFDPSAPDPFARNKVVYRDVKPEDVQKEFSPEERAAMDQVRAEFQRNRGLFKQFGIDGIQPARAEGEASGLATSEGKLSVDGGKLLEQFQTVKERGADPKQWVRRALIEEIVHQATIKGLGPKWRTKLEAVWNDPNVPQEMREAAAKAYDGFDDELDENGNIIRPGLDPHQKAAELVRMVVQGEWKGTITEQIFNAIRDLHAYLLGIDAKGSPLLQEAIDQTRSVLTEARRRVVEERRATRSAARPESGRLTHQENEERVRLATAKWQAGDEERFNVLARREMKHGHDEPPQNSGSPVTEPATPAPEAQGRKPNFKFTVNDGGFSQDPIVARIMEHGGLLSKSASKAQMGADKYARNAGESEDAATMQHPSHNSIYSKDGMTPDEAVAVLHGDSHEQPAIVREGFSTADLWAHLDRASKTAKGIMDQQAGMKRSATEQAKQARDFAKDTEARGKGEHELTAWDISPGDTVKVGTESMKVVSVDPKNNSFVLEDGKKYGLQEVDGHVFGKLEKANDELGASKAKRKDAGGQRDMFVGPDAPFNLAGEKGEDGFRVSAEREQARKDTEGAARRRETDQMTLFASKADEGITKRLEILRSSLAKKEAEFDARLSAHFDDVKGANGQPLNDKSNGRATIGRWERQNDALRNLKDSITVTKAAIQREEDAISHVESVGVPPALREMVDSGELVQWRKHPNTFFVKGVDKGRIYWDPDQSLVGYKYVSDIPKEQYPVFRDAFNKAKARVREHAERNANPDSLSAARAKTAAQKEAERLAKLRETRAGFAAELAAGKSPDAETSASQPNESEASRFNGAASGRGQDAATDAPVKPEPHILTKPEGRSVMNAYHHLARTTGFPAVSIAELADQSGIPLDRLKQQLLRSQKAGNVALSTGDWSLSSDKVKSGVIEDKGQKMLQVRFLNDGGGMAAARAKSPAEKEAMRELPKIAEKARARVTARVEELTQEAAKIRAELNGDTPATLRRQIDVESNARDVAETSARAIQDRLARLQWNGPSERERMKQAVVAAIKQGDDPLPAGHSVRELTENYTFKFAGADAAWHDRAEFQRDNRFPAEKVDAFRHEYTAPRFAVFKGNSLERSARTGQTAENPQEAIRRHHIKQAQASAEAMRHYAEKYGVSVEPLEGEAALRSELTALKEADEEAATRIAELHKRAKTAAAIEGRAIEVESRAKELQRYAERIPPAINSSAGIDTMEGEGHLTPEEAAAARGHAEEIAAGKEADEYLASEQGRAERQRAANLRDKQTTGARDRSARITDKSALWSDLIEKKYGSVASKLAHFWKSVATDDEAFVFPKSTARDPDLIAQQMSIPGHAMTATEKIDEITFHTAQGELSITGIRSDKPEISAASAGSKGKKQGGGAQLYQAALAWAHNNGKKIYPSNALTPINKFVRRTSNMLSSALRFGTTKHMTPDKEQGVKWKSGADSYNVGQLALREMEQVFKAVPELQKLTFDFDTAKVRDEHGAEVTPAELEARLLEDKESSFDRGIGRSTAQRAIITASALRELESGEAAGDGRSLEGRGARVSDEQGSVLYASRAAAIHAKIADSLIPARAEMRSSGTRREITQDHDAGENAANNEGERVGNSIRLDFARPKPANETGAQRKARETEETADREAMPFVIENGIKPLAQQRADILASSDSKLIASELPKVDRAIRDFSRLTKLRTNHDRTMALNMAQLKAAGVQVGEVQDYITRKLDLPDAVKDTLPSPMFAMGNGQGGSPRYFTKGRSFATLSEAIKAGYKPQSTDIAKLDALRIAAGRKIVEQRAFFDKLKATPSPTDGKPIIGEMIDRPLANGKTEQTVPHGYKLVQAAGRPLVVHEQFADLFRNLFGQSALRSTIAGRAALKLAAFAKHGTLLFDTFHVGRLLFKMAAGGGGSPLQMRDGKPALGYHDGLSLLEYSDGDLNRAQAHGDLTAREVAFARRNRPALQQLVKAGLNVGKVSDNLMEQAGLHIPGLETANKWIFGKLSRGAMVQTALKFYDRNLSRPGMSREQAARRTATEMNEYSGNLQNQGIFKSKTLQDVARLIFLAPNWTESQFRYEARAYGQVGASALDLARGRGLRSGNATRAMATGFVALLAANQVANYLSRGQSTFENEEDGHKLDAWVPGGKRGFWFNPFEIAGEYAHAAMKYAAQHENPVDIATHIASNKLSPLGRGVKEAGTGRDAMGRHFLSDADRFRSAAVDSFPSPMPLGGFFEKDPRSPIGYRMNRQPGSIQKQVMQSAGAKVTAAQSPRTQMFSLAQPFRPEGQYNDNAGEFTELRRALDNDQPDDVKSELRWLLDRGKEMKAIASALGIHSGGIAPERFTGGVEREKEMLKSLTPQQQKTYALAQSEHRANAKKFLAIAHSPEGQQIIAEARRKAASKKPAMAN